MTTILKIWTGSFFQNKANIVANWWIKPWGYWSSVIEIFFLLSRFQGKAARFDQFDSSFLVIVCVKFVVSLRADEIKLWLTLSAKQRRNPCSGLPALYRLCTHIWVRATIGQFVCLSRSPVRLKINSKRTSGNSMSPLGVQNKDLCAASQTLLIRV